MLGRCRRDPARNAAQAILDQLFQGPSCTVTGKHGQIMNVNVRILVRSPHFIVINLRQPVIRCDSAGVAENQTADRIGHC